MGPAWGLLAPTEKSCCQSFCRQRANTSGTTRAGGVVGFAYAVPVPALGPSERQSGFPFFQGFHIDGFQLVQLRLPAF